MGEALAAVAALKGLLSAVDSDVLLKYSNWIPVLFLKIWLRMAVGNGEEMSVP
jgi:hypothetical protein